MDYQPVVVKKHPRPSTAKHSAESRYWRQFKHPVFVKEYAEVTSIHFSPSKPHRYAVTAATRVQIYAPRTQKVTKTISRFKDVARSGSIRGDGKLVIAGDDSGLVQVRSRTSLMTVSNPSNDESERHYLHELNYWCSYRSSTSTHALFSVHWTRINSQCTSQNSLLYPPQKSSLAQTTQPSNSGTSLHKPPYPHSRHTRTTFVRVKYPQQTHISSSQALTMPLYGYSTPALGSVKWSWGEVPVEVEVAVTPP